MDKGGRKVILHVKKGKPMKNPISRRPVPWPRLMLLAFIMLISSCSEPPREPLRIASSPWPGYEPLYLARDLGYLDRTRFKLFELPSSDITMESFRNRSTDLATLTLDETIELIHSGTRVKILLILDISHGGDAVLARPGINGLRDIKGKRVSIVNIPLGLYMLSRTLDAAGLSRDDVSVFPMAESKQLNFYKQGKADVIITFEPVKTKLLESGAHVIFDSSKIPNEIFDMLVVHEDVYLERREELCQVVRTWFRTLRHMKQQPEDTANRISKRLKVSVKDYHKMMEGIRLPDGGDNKNILGGKNPSLLVPAKKLGAIMLNENLLSHPVDISGAIDPNFAHCFAE